MAPFGNPEDTSYAETLWQTMLDANMAGDDAIRSFPYEGTEPHGFVLETFYTKATINGHTGDLVIKRNYGPEGVSVEEVQEDAKKHLAAITVMFKREAGYDTENKDWFWAKFLPDGSLDKNPKGMQLAGKVAKGNSEAGCIACHSNDDDYIFTTNHIK
ncbi:MAG: cytochrome P460 family protein [Rhizobiales bacterium]|nr:cytochrome P460 family protein [Hyphomicrobiales bacterium]